MSPSLKIHSHPENAEARAFCDEFLQTGLPKFVFGRNVRAQSMGEAIAVDGFIDDYTKEREFCGRPVVTADQVPKDALVASSVTGQPLTANKRLKALGLRSVDYFAFKRYADIPIAPIRHWDQFRIDFAKNRSRYEQVFKLLADDESRRTMSDLINFRLSYDLSFMDGRTDRQYDQYFEAFLDLAAARESFLDIGCFDGHTTLEFIKRCPGYDAIHVFEPNPENMITVQGSLAHLPRIVFHPFGVSDRTQTLRFETQGSHSHISNTGTVLIEVRPLDEAVDRRFTFLKMDIEGQERTALVGAKHSIARHTPRMAIAAYHKFDDFWRIPEDVLAIHENYRIYMRHYTEGVDETVMFFMPD